MSPALQRAFVAGATGYTGREIVRQLRERGVGTVAHVRPGSRSAARWVPRFREWGAEVAEVVWEPPALAAELARAQPDAIFSVIGTTRAAARSDRIAGADIYEAVDYRLTVMLVGAAREAAAGARLVYLSSIGADSAARSRYMRARGRVEDELAASGLPYTIARPSFITGPGRDDRRLGERATAGALDGLLGVARVFGARRLRDRYRSIDSVHLAAALIAAAADPACAGAVLEGDALHRLAASAC